MSALPPDPTLIRLTRTLLIAALANYVRARVERPGPVWAANMVPDDIATAAAQLIDAVFTDPPRSPRTSER